MSATLHLWGRAPRSPDVDPATIADAVVARARAARPTLRLVARHHDGALCLEPFLAGAAFDALRHIPKKRPSVLEALRAVVEELFLRYRQVDIELSDARRSAPLVDQRVSLAEALDAVISADHARLSITPPLLAFHVHEARARLFAPLPVEGGDVATGYLRDFDVLAIDEREVRSLLTSDLAEDGASLVQWSSVELQTTEDAGPPRVLGRSGRVFFGGE
ncbi:MAG: hypothetical protein ABJE95_00495 [Byssovorax sp.]